MSKLIYKNGLFILPSHGVEARSEIESISGFKYSKKLGWNTTNPLTAFSLRHLADDKVKDIFQKSLIIHRRWREAVIVPDDESTLPHQIPAALFSLNRNRSYLALAPGLGKTIVAALIAASIGQRVLYICPPSLTINTLNEFKRWAPSLKTGILGSADWNVPDVLIVPDSMIHDVSVRYYIKFFKPRVMFVDEAHRLSNPKSRRSEAFYGYYTKVKKERKYWPGIVDRNLLNLTYLSGTPSDGRPIELYSILKKSAPQYMDFVSYHKYGMKYCAGYMKLNDYQHTKTYGKPMGLDFSGCSEKPFKELVNKFRTHDAKDKKAFMLRQNKEILGLPPLTETVLFLSEDMPRELRSMDNTMVKKYSPKDLIKYSMAQSVGKEAHDLHIAEYRKLLGIHKVKPAAKYYREVLEDTDEKIILSAYHKPVLYLLGELFADYDPFIIDGSTSTVTKTNMVNDFQKRKKKRLILLNYVAGGLGLTLTEANRIGLIEYAWGPNANRQIIDRGHRYTLKHPFLAQYCIFQNSLDAHTFSVNDKKRRITSFI